MKQNKLESRKLYYLILAQNKRFGYIDELTGSKSDVMCANYSMTSGGGDYIIKKKMGKKKQKTMISQSWEEFQSSYIA